MKGEATLEMVLFDERRSVRLVDLADLLQAVDIRLIKALDPSSAAIIAAGAKLTFRAAGAPQRLADDLLAFFSCCIFDQDRFHNAFPPCECYFVSMRIFMN